MVDAATERSSGRTPPYHGFSALSMFIRDLKAHGVPPRIDQGTMGAVPRTVRGQLMTGIRFLGLTTGTNEPTPLLRELVAAYETDRWVPTLGRMLRESYGDLFKVDLATVTPVHLLDEFKQYGDASEEVRRKCLTFFLAAAKEANIPMGVRLTQRRGRGSGLPGRRHKRPAKREGAPENGAASVQPTAASPLPGGEGAHLRHKHPHLPQLIEALVASLPDEGASWTLDEAADWLQTAAYNFRYAYKMAGILKVEITPIPKVASA